MGTFSTKCRVEHPANRARAAVVPKLWVDTGSEYTWIPAGTLERLGIPREKKDVPFVLANGQMVTRGIGFGIIRLDKYFTTDEIVFAEPGDLPLLGARTLDGLNLTVDAPRKRLVPAGPVLAASPTTLRVASRRRPSRPKRRTSS